MAQKRYVRGPTRFTLRAAAGKKTGGLQSSGKLIATKGKTSTHTLTLSINNARAEALLAEHEARYLLGKLRQGQRAERVERLFRRLVEKAKQRFRTHDEDQEPSRYVSSFSIETSADLEFVGFEHTMMPNPLTPGTRQKPKPAPREAEETPPKQVQGRKDD